LDRVLDVRWEFPLVSMAALPADFDLGLVLGDLDPLGWHIEDLPLDPPVGSLIPQRAPAAAARLDAMVDDMVRLGDRAQGRSGMPDLTSRSPTARLPKALGRGPHHVGGRRLRRILRVLVQPRLRFPGLRFSLPKPFLKLAHLSFKRGDSLLARRVRVSGSPLHPSV
jgi:hypothetical protein